MEPSSSVPNSEGARKKALMSLFLQHQRSIYAYIFTLVPNKFDADDILQETCVTLFEKFDDFEIGTDFVLWANRIAYWKVRAARQKFARSKVIFDEELTELVSQTAVNLQNEVDDRHEILELCLQKLNRRDHDMVLTRYASGGTAEEGARVSKRSILATYKALNRARQFLHDCINYSVLQEERSIES